MTGAALLRSAPSLSSWRSFLPLNCQSGVALISTVAGLERQLDEVIDAIGGGEARAGTVRSLSIAWPLPR